jgi:hypothetical protein
MRKLLPLSEDKQGPRTRHGYEADLWHMAVMMKSEQGAVTTGWQLLQMAMCKECTSHSTLPRAPNIIFYTYIPHLQLTILQ